MTKREKCKLMADRYLRVAERTNRSDVRKFSGIQDDLAMIRMFHDDLLNHVKAVALIRKGKLEDAFEAMQNMDTAARDTVPVTVYNWLEKETE